MNKRVSLESRHASQVLTSVPAASDTESVTVGELTVLLQSRALGFLLALVGLINCVPLPPGVSSLAGIPVFVLGLQMVTGRTNPWLPASIRRRAFKRRDLARTFAWAEPYLHRLERASRPRFPAVVQLLYPRVVGIMVLLLSLFIMIPMVFTNIPPALATVFLAIALIEEDGLLLAVGLVLAIVAMVVSATLAAGTVALVLRAMRGSLGV